MYLEVLAVGSFLVLRGTFSYGSGGSLVDRLYEPLYVCISDMAECFNLPASIRLLDFIILGEIWKKRFFSFIVLML